MARDGKAFGIESNTTDESNSSEILVFPMDRREETSKNTRRGMFGYPPMATRHPQPTYSDEADGDQDTGATAAEVVGLTRKRSRSSMLRGSVLTDLDIFLSEGECHIVIPDSQPTDPDEDSHDENTGAAALEEEEAVVSPPAVHNDQDLATGGRTDKRSGVKRSRNSSSRSFPWSDMSLNERMSRCREVAGKVETLVGQPLPDTLACIRGCIADVSITSRAAIYSLFEEDALLEVPAELRNVSWQDDAEFVAGSTRRAAENLPDAGIHAIPTLLAVLFHYDFHQTWNKGEFERAVASGRRALYGYIQQLIRSHGMAGAGSRNWSLAIREDCKPLAPHLRAIFQSKEAAVLVYSNDDERIDLRFGLEDVLATYLTKRKLIWSVDHRYNAFWCSHVVAWVRESFSIIEDFCAGVSRDDIVYAGEGILSTNRLIVWASGRMCTTARCAGLLTKVSESGMICPCVMDVDTKEPCKVRIHQAVGMIKYGVNRKTLGSEWYEREGITLDHMARDTAYFGIFQLMAATWEEQCLNKTCLQDIAPEKFQPLEALQHDADTKAAILENGEKGWKQCRVRVDSYASADLAECRRNKETVVTGLCECHEPLMYHPTFHCLRLEVRESSYIYLNVRNLSRLCFPERSSYFVRTPSVFGYPIHHLVHDTMCDDDSVTLVGQGTDGKYHIYVVDHVQNDPTDASLVQMLTMSENTAKDVGLPVKARLLLPGCDDGGLSENRRYIDVSEGDKTSMALKIQEHFKSPGFEGDVIAERICSLSVKTIVCCWFGNRRGVHRDYNKHVIVDEAESLESYTKCRECIYKIWHTAVESNNATEYITSQAQMKARILHITGAPGIPDHFFESAWIFNAHPKYRREVFKTLGNGAVVDVTLIFDASPDRAFTEYTIKDLIDNESGTVSGYIGVVNFVLSRPTPMEGTWMKNKHAWYLEIHKALDVKGDENTKKKYLFNRFEITNKAVDIARLRTRKTYTVQFPEKPHLNSGTCDRKEMEEVLRKTVHNEITYDMIVSLVNQGSEAKVREDIRKAFTQSRVTIGGFQRKKASNNTTKEWRYPSYFVMSKQWCEEHQSSFEIMQQDVAIEKANSSALAVDSVKEGLRSGDFKMLHFRSGKERNKFLDDYFPDLTRWFSTSARLVRETTNSYLLSDDMKDCPVKCFISGHDKPERPDVIIKSRAFVVKYQANSQEVFKEAIKIFLKEKVSEEESLVSSSPSPVLEVLRDSRWVTRIYSKNKNNNNKSNDPRNLNCKAMMKSLSLVPVDRITSKTFHISGKPWYDPSHENEEGVPFVFRRVEGPEEACNDPNAKKSYNLQNKNLSKGEEEEFECYFVLVAQKI
ncbi:hypothetical protein PSENEW3_00000035 [Picochlorum sp. SENEW3]|nr:hypothetical protein PSENEW3_00000035 [Picochlorum sp. SENEW3]